jgi:hypothetical protein
MQSDPNNATLHSSCYNIVEESKEIEVSSSRSPLPCGGDDGTGAQIRALFQVFHLVYFYRPIFLLKNLARDKFQLYINLL